ncbi:hypothetical protein ACX6XY_13195 [Streptomyces sp. O3]
MASHRRRTGTARLVWAYGTVVVLLVATVIGIAALTGDSGGSEAGASPVETGLAAPDAAELGRGSPSPEPEPSTVETIDPAAMDSLPPTEPDAVVPEKYRALMERDVKLLVAPRRLGVMVTTVITNHGGEPATYELELRVTDADGGPFHTEGGIWPEVRVEPGGRYQDEERYHEVLREGIDTPVHPKVEVLSITRTPV